MAISHHNDRLPSNTNRNTNAIFNSSKLNFCFENSELFSKFESSKL